MNNPMDQFKQTYFTECSELLEDMQQRLLQLDSVLDNPAELTEQLNAIFRCAHSIKGGGGAFGFDRLVNFTHTLEYVLDALRENKLTANPEVVDMLLQSVDVVTALVTAAQSGQELPAEHGELLQRALMDLLGEKQPAATKHSEAPSDAQAPVKQKAAYFVIHFAAKPDLLSTGNEPVLILKELLSLGEGTVKTDISRIPTLSILDAEQCYLAWEVHLHTDKDEAAIREVFEFVEDHCELTIGKEKKSAAMAAQKEAAVEAHTEDPAEVVTAAPMVATRQTESAAQAPAQQASPAVTSIRVDIDKVDTLVNMVGELVITQAMLMQQAKHIPPEEFPGIIKGVEELSRHTRELQDAVMAVRMQPIKSIFSRMPRLVRDLAKQLNKKVHLEMIGENTEIDKTVIEQLGDPLTHMIRNSLDHGLETPEDRVKAGKKPEGTVTLSADHSGGRIIIRVEDDGRGINRQKVLDKARSKGLIAPDATLSDEQMDQLVFLPGFSTAEQVTNVSGRGVGMDVVRRNISDMGGTVELINLPGEGTQFVISLPLTLAILDGMIVRVADEQYIIPLNNIIETLHPKSDQLQTMADGQTVMNVRGTFVPIMALESAFSIPRRSQREEMMLVVLVEIGKHTFGIAVDEIIGQQQVVIKNIEENSNPIEGVSGATILGDGNIALILDIAKLYQMRSKGLLKLPSQPQPTQLRAA